MCIQNDFPDWRTQLSESHVTCAKSRLTDSDKQDDRPTGQNTTRGTQSFGINKDTYTY